MVMKAKKVSINDLVRETGYSKSTVSKAINGKGRMSEETREKILAKAKELNFVPDYHAQALSKKESWMIGVIYPENIGVGFSHPFFSVVIDSFKKQVEKMGYEIIFLNPKMGSKKMNYIDYCKYRNIDGVLVVTADHDDQDVIDLMESDIPVVCTDSPAVDAFTVVSDDYTGGVLATEYLLSLGHKEIMHIAGPLTVKAALDRFRGFEDTMFKHGFKGYHLRVANNFTYDDGYQIVKDLIKINYIPSAFFISSDWMAVGAIKAFHEAGIKVPEDISIIGYDNIEYFKYFNPSLTTVSQDARKIGETAAISLKQKIDGKEVTPIKLEVQIVKRETCRRKEN